MLARISPIVRSFTTSAIRQGAHTHGGTPGEVILLKALCVFLTYVKPNTSMPVNGKVKNVTVNYQFSELM